MSSIGTTEPIVDDRRRSIIYFNGRILTADDLRVDQEYAREMHRTLGKGIGAGVVRGLFITKKTGSPGPDRVCVEAGLAVDAKGNTLSLSNAVELRIFVGDEPPVDAPSTEVVGFRDCPTPSTAPPTFTSGHGAWILSITSAATTSGRAPTNAQAATTDCTWSFQSEGVQFRLDPVGAALLPSLSPALRYRNRLAHTFFGTSDGRVVRSLVDPFGADPQPELITGLVTDCEVPLALLVLGTQGSIDIVEPWAVRRLAGQRREPTTAEAVVYQHQTRRRQATYHQFQQQIGELTTASSNVAALTHFAHLPAAGLLPLKLTRGAMTPGVVASDFWNGLTTESEQVDVSEVEAILRESLDHPPIDLDAAAASNTPIRTYSIRENTTQLGVQSYQLFTSHRMLRRRHPPIPPPTKTGCTYSLKDGDDLAAVLANIRGGDDAKICLDVGTYRLGGTATVRYKGNIVISGAGRGTKIVVDQTEVALQFERCKSVRLVDLEVRSKRSISGGPPLRRLRGAVTVVDVETVELERLVVRSEGGPRYRASCIAVYGAPRGSHRTRIRDCELLVGHRQGAILVVDGHRTVIENNVVRIAPNQGRYGILHDFSKMRRVRRELGRLMAYGPTFGAKQTTAAGSRVAVTLNGRTIRFGTWASLTSLWSALAGQIAPPATMTNGFALFERLKQAAIDALFTDDLSLPTAARTQLTQWRSELLNPIGLVAGTRGIVVAGGRAEEVTIRGNQVRGCREGIRVAVSTNDQKRGVLRIDRVVVTDNDVQLRITPLVTGGRFGIFVGNARSAIVSGNRIRVSRFVMNDRLRVIGTCVIGWVGPMIVVEQNHIENASIGIYFHGMNYVPPAERQFLIANNVAPGTQTSVLVRGGTSSVQGLSTNRPPP